MHGGERYRQDERENVFTIERERSEHNDGRNREKSEGKCACQPRIVEKPARIVNRAESENQKRSGIESEFAAVEIDKQRRRQHRQSEQYGGGHCRHKHSVRRSQNVVRRRYKIPDDAG